MKVKLKQFRGGDHLADFGQGHGAESGHAEHGAEFLGGAGDGALAIMMKQSLQGRGRAENRHVQFLAHDGHRHVDSFDTGQYIRHQVAIFKCRGVASIAHLIICGAIDIIKDWPGQALFRQQAKILHIVAILETSEHGNAWSHNAAATVLLLQLLIPGF